MIISITQINSGEDKPPVRSPADSSACTANANTNLLNALGDRIPLLANPLFPRGLQLGLQQCHTAAFERHIAKALADAYKAIAKAEVDAHKANLQHTRHARPRSYFGCHCLLSWRGDT